MKTLTAVLVAAAMVLSFGSAPANAKTSCEYMGRVQTFAVSKSENLPQLRTDPAMVATFTNFCLKGVELREMGLSDGEVMDLTESMRKKAVARGDGENFSTIVASTVYGGFTDGVK